MPTFTLHPKLVLTARYESPKSPNNLVKDVVSCIRGRSSAITQHIRTQDRFSPFACQQNIIRLLTDYLTTGPTGRLSIFTTQSWLSKTLEKKPFGNIVGKREDAGNQHFLLIPQFFIKT